MGILGNATGGFCFPKTYILVDENENEILTASYIESETIFTATDNDVREGAVYAGDSGVSTGTKVIPAYHTYQGTRFIDVGSTLTLQNIDSKIDSYDYTKLQAIVCAYDTNIANSVLAVKVSIDDNVYSVQSDKSESIITKNHNSKIVDFGITNDTSTPLIIRYFMYKEIA